MCCAVVVLSAAERVVMLTVTVVCHVLSVVDGVVLCIVVLPIAGVDSCVLVLIDQKIVVVGVFGHVYNEVDFDVDEVMFIRGNGKDLHCELSFCTHSLAQCERAPMLNGDNKGSFRSSSRDHAQSSVERL